MVEFKIILNRGGMNTMKKMFVIFAAVFMVLFHGCGSVTQEDYDKLVAEKEEISKELETVKADYDKLVAEKEEISKELETVKADYEKLSQEKQELMEETESDMQQEPIVEETETQEEIPHRDGMYGISDKKISALDSSFSVSDVRNDVTGKWRISVVAENMQMVEYALNYYNLYIHNNEEVHGIVNFNNYTTTYISSLGMDNRLFVTVHEYVDGEEHDANLLFSGMVLEDYIVYTDNGDIEKIQ